MRRIFPRGGYPQSVDYGYLYPACLRWGASQESERANIDRQCQAKGRSLEQALTEATHTLSDLSHCAGLVFAPKSESPLQHIEFISLDPGRALVVMVTRDGLVENRLIDIPPVCHPVR